jgi:hypothetical protein
VLKNKKETIAAIIMRSDKRVKGKIQAKTKQKTMWPRNKTIMETEKNIICIIN